MIQLIALSLLSGLVFITYLAYPLLVRLLSMVRGGVMRERSEFRGRVFVFMAARNEALVIGRKLESLVNSDFPRERLICFAGSDASNDGTTDILRSFSGRIPLHILHFEHRTGKPGIINVLVAKARELYDINGEDLFLMTDANVLLHPEFIGRMAGAFADPQLGLADGVIRQPDNSRPVSAGENTYLKWETRLKYAEGELWGCAMGPFGGAYMMRPELYREVPPKMLVDDFFLFYHIVRSGRSCRVVPDAVCYESPAAGMASEYRRKKRIAAGNFQNIWYYRHSMAKWWKRYNTVFFCHKLLRWLTPWMLAGVMLLLLLGVPDNKFYGPVLLIMLILISGVPLLHYLLNKLNLSARWLQGAAYFVVMNIAMAAGLIQFLKGIRNNVWEPTERTA